MIFDGCALNHRLDDAIQLLEKIPDVVAWNSMINGYLKFQRVDEGVNLLLKMPHWNMVGSGVKLSSNTLSCVLKAFANVMALHLGVQTSSRDACAVFSEKRYGNLVIWTASSCGLEALDKAKETLAMVFMRSLDSEVFVGNSLVVLYTLRGNNNDAGVAFYNVGEKNVALWNSVTVDVHSMVKPDAFFSILVYINSLRQSFSTMFVWLMPWDAFNLGAAERGAKSILYLELNCSASYVLLPNIYASAGERSDVSRMRMRMKQGGIVPDERFALHDLEDEQKQEMLPYHRKRLADAFRLVTTAESSTITVFKNLRACANYHSAIMIIAKIAGLRRGKQLGFKVAAVRWNKRETGQSLY
ncbi:pentatricopeptide repeat-containing protein At5g46460, mitochondrial-like [Gossypium hirsutum]|uniref:Pentatricopeptide repeat-containing protein At5g46460, mitochondrial-like n=1 Tax=Gossypium hirsutum TaxID=3635 RepID=A0ABM2YNM0_GOSHI|nr:pentatricopeptide repeat-containing protein At5g46460, mitochondrial-like [Gossypium hirsutum]